MIAVAALAAYLAQSIAVAARIAWLERRRRARIRDWDVHCESALRMLGARGVQR